MVQLLDNILEPSRELAQFDAIIIRKTLVCILEAKSCNIFKTFSMIIKCLS